jgi:T-complex protein 1 subunit beta
VQSQSSKKTLLKSALKTRDWYSYLTKASFVGAIAVGDLVKSTLGPKGMVESPLTQDKILQSLSNQNDVMVTNDGATILKSIALDNAAAKVLVSTSG